MLGHEASGTIRAVGSEVRDRTPGQRVALEPQETCGRCKRVPVRALQPVPGRPVLRHAADPWGLRAVRGAGRDPRPSGARQRERRGGGPDRAAVGGGLGGSQGRHRARRPGAGDRRRTGRAALRRRRPGPRGGVRSGQRHQPRPARGGRRPRARTRPSTCRPARWRSSSIRSTWCWSAAGSARPSQRLRRRRARRPDRAGRDGQPTLELPVATIQQRELLVTGTFRYANTYPAAIALAASGAVDLDGLVTAKFGLEQVAEALTVAKTDPHTLKPMVYPGVDRI